MGQTKKSKLATSIADTTVNGVLGQTMGVNCPASLLLQDQGKTGKERPAKFNTSRSMEELNALETLRCLMVFVKLSIPSQIAVLVALKVPGVIGLIVLFLVAMVAQREELVWLHPPPLGTPTLPFVAMPCLCVVLRRKSKTAVLNLVLKIVSVVTGQLFRTA